AALGREARLRAGLEVGGVVHVDVDAGPDRVGLGLEDVLGGLPVAVEQAVRQRREFIGRRGALGSRDEQLVGATASSTVGLTVTSRRSDRGRIFAGRELLPDHPIFVVGVREALAGPLGQAGIGAVRRVDVDLGVLLVAGGHRNHAVVGLEAEQELVLAVLRDVDVHAAVERI